MKNYVNISKWLLFISLIKLSPSAGAIDSYKEFKEGLLELQYRGQYISTDSNFNTQGSIVSLGSGKYFKIIDSEVAARLGFAEQWSAEMGFHIPSVESNDGVAKRSNSTLSEMSVGLETIVLTKYVDFIPEFQAVFPLEPFSLSQTTAVNGEGVMQLKLLLNMQKNMGTWSPYGYFGFQHRAEGRGGLLPWLLGVNFGKENIFGAEIFGYQIILEDKDAPDKTARLNLVSNVNAGSYYYTSVNPILVDSKAYYRAHMSDFWMFQFEMGITPLGWDAAYSYHVGGFIRFNIDLWEGSPIAKTRIKRRIKLNKDDFINSEDKENVKEFQEDTKDGV
ncbi:MAG TPA: hypothetical protein PLJ21_09155, partial [Pseudobdellovibrionaceae bacterium]|nr:hypothetical protein [Pseudobdellovibrionaceae bacterium]